MRSVFRGHWCPFCISYLKKLQRLTGSIESKSGTVTAVKSEQGTEQPSIRDASGYQGSIIADERNELATELKVRNVLDIAITPKNGYAHGMMQPAIIVLKGDWEKVLFRWATVPSLMNFGGAKDRPDLEQVWDNVQAQIESSGPKYAKVKATSAIALLYEKILGQLIL